MKSKALLLTIIAIIIITINCSKEKYSESNKYNKSDNSTKSSVKKVSSGRHLYLRVHPYLSAIEIGKRFAPLINYLNKKSGQNIQLRISKSYKSHIKNIGTGKFDLAYMGPVPYVKMRHSYGRKQLLARIEVDGKQSFRGVIIVLSNSQLTSVKELKGRTFAFSDPNSTMGYLIPRYILLKYGVTMHNLEKYAFLRSHHNVAMGVLGGYYDAGAIKESVFIKYRNQGLRKLIQGPPITTHLFLASNKMEKKLVILIKHILLNLKDKTILSAIKKSITGMTTVKDQEYNKLRQILFRLNSLKID